jgi:hypothetical protein
MATPRTYTTVAGDQWDYISYQLWGTEYYSDQLQYANPAYANVWVFSPNIALTVPVVPPPKTVQTPPWVQIS